jgi:hypothetical protein
MLNTKKNILKKVVITAALGSAIILTSCLKLESGGGGAVVGTKTISTSCSASIIDYGQKGVVAASARGSYSDLALSPSTDALGGAYFDASSLSVKFSYWTGENFSTEVIAGEGVAAFVKLVYSPDGKPVVFWTQGTSVKAAFRSTPPPAVGTWSAGVIDTGVAPRALDAAVNPLGQIGVTFLTDTATTGRPKFLYCDTPCTGPSSFQIMTPNPYVDNTAIIATQVNSSVAWCQVSPTQYYPAVAYSVTGQTRYAVCRNTLANCLNHSNWQTQNVVAVGSVSKSLYINPDVVGDSPKMAILGDAGIVAYNMDAACTAAPTTFTASVAIGAATTGTQWLKLLADAAGKFHIFANEAATALRYYNSQTTTITGAWNTANTLETIATPTAFQGGAVVDNTSGGIYFSYPTNARLFDLRAGRIEDYAVASNLARTSRFDIDLTGALQLVGASAQLGNISSASTLGGRPGAAYVDFSAGAATTGRLKYAIRKGNTADSGWDYSIVGDTISPQFPSLAFDQFNKPWIGYFEANTNRFFLAQGSSTEGNGTWSHFEFPSLPAGAPIALPAANQVAVVMQYTGGVLYPVMIVLDNNATSRGLKAARFNQSTQAWSAVVTIDALGASGASHLSATSDASGNVAIAWRDLTLTRARYSHTADAVTWTAALSVSAVNQGMGAKLRFNPATGSPAMSYFDRGNNAVYYAACAGTPASCATSGWNPVAVDSAVGLSGLLAGNEQALTSDISFSTAGVATVLYPRGQGSSGSLMRASNATGSFVVTELALGANGATSGSAALNFGISGWHVVTSTNAAGGMTATHLGPGNWLYSTSCGD